MGNCLNSRPLCEVCSYYINTRDNTKYTNCCDKLFHYRCFIGWSKIHNSCPGCRIPIVRNIESFYL